MKLLSYEFDKDKLMITFDSSFSKIKLQKLESPSICSNDGKYLKMECDVIEFTFSKPKSTLSLYTSENTQIIILVIIDIDGQEENEAMMFSKQSGDENEQVGLVDGLGMLLTGAHTKPKPFEKNESQRVYATIRRKVTNGNR